MFCQRVKIINENSRVEFYNQSNWSSIIKVSENEETLLTEDQNKLLRYSVSEKIHLLTSVNGDIQVW